MCNKVPEEVGFLFLEVVAMINLYVGSQSYDGFGSTLELSVCVFLCVRACVRVMSTERY